MLAYLARTRVPEAVVVTGRVCPDWQFGHSPFAAWFAAPVLVGTRLIGRRCLVRTRTSYGFLVLDQT